MAQARGSEPHERRDLRGGIGQWVLAGSAVVTPLSVWLLATVVCDGSCYPHPESALLLGIPLFACGSVAGVVMTRWSPPTRQRHIGWALLVAAVPYGLLVGGVVGTVTGGGSGDYLVMTVAGYAFGLLCLLVWLLLGTITVIVGARRGRRASSSGNR